MKTISLIFLLSCLPAVHASAQPELDLETEMHALDGRVYRARAKNFKNVFRLKNAVLPDFVTEKTTYNELDNLLRKTPPPSGKAYFKVLRIFYGLTENGNRIKLFYVPDIAEETSVIDSFSLHYSFPILDPKAKVCSLNSDGVFVPCGLQEMNSAAARYHFTGNVLWNKYGDPEQPNFQPLTRFEQNMANTCAAGVLISYAEIKALLKESPLVYISSLPELDEVNGNNFYKHAVALSPVAPDIASRAHLIANLTTLCPLSCGNIGTAGAPNGGIRIAQKSLSFTQILALFGGLVLTFLSGFWVRKRFFR